MNKLENNPAVEWKERRNNILSCSMCPPNKNENIKRNCKLHKRHVSWKLKRKTRFLE